jgi:hypothetical protein
MRPSSRDCEPRTSLTELLGCTPNTASDATAPPASSSTLPRTPEPLTTLRATDSSRGVGHSVNQPFHF